MEKLDLFKDISERTGGDVYIGVVGPVRTGKSTFIKRFMEALVLPQLPNEAERQRAKDELPQSSAGKTIMTTEPKFIPNQAVQVAIAQDVAVKVRLVDCVGYTVDGALGLGDEKGPRMVQTPWFEQAIPFHEAAEIGTRKVIQDHSTIGIVVTTDGTINEWPRSAFLDGERRVVEELKQVGKPFVIVLNSAQPFAADTAELRSRMMEEYEIPVVAMSVETMREVEALQLLKEALYEFPLLEVDVQIPDWVAALKERHPLRRQFEQALRDNVQTIQRIRDVEAMIENFSAYDVVQEARLLQLELGQVRAIIELQADELLYEQTILQLLNVESLSRATFIQLLEQMVEAKREYDQIADALKMVKQTGYGIAAPALEDMSLDEPEIIRQGARFGVRLKAVAPSIHLIKVDVESEFSPIIGTERQSEELVHYLMQDFENEPLAIWNSDIFGRSLSSIVREGIQAKISLMPENVRYKLKETLERMINDGSGGLIAIIL